jgi:hypothetical protein
MEKIIVLNPNFNPSMSVIGGDVKEGYSIFTQEYNRFTEAKMMKAVSGFGSMEEAQKWLDQKRQDM